MAGSTLPDPSGLLAPLWCADRPLASARRVPSTAPPLPAPFPPCLGQGSWLVSHLSSGLPGHSFQTGYAGQGHCPEAREPVSEVQKDNGGHFISGQGFPKTGLCPLSRGSWRTEVRPPLAGMPADWGPTSGLPQAGDRPTYCPCTPWPRPRTQEMRHKGHLPRVQSRPAPPQQNPRSQVPGAAPGPELSPCQSQAKEKAEGGGRNPQFSSRGLVSLMLCVWTPGQVRGTSREQGCRPQREPGGPGLPASCRRGHRAG